MKITNTRINARRKILINSFMMVAIPFFLFASVHGIAIHFKIITYDLDPWRRLVVGIMAHSTVFMLMPGAQWLSILVK